MDGPLTTRTSVDNRKVMSDVEKARRKIDHELATLRQTELELLSRRNTLSSICALPPELLSLIFLHCVDDSFSQSHWIQITYVCRHWHNVAFSCPALWTRLSLVNAPWTTQMLKRSKHAPLYVSADLSWRTSTISPLEPLVEEVSRLRDVDLNLSRETAIQFVGRLTQPAPLLQSLQITIPPPNFYVTSRGENVQIPTQFLGGSAPALRRLRMTNFDLPWDSSVLQGLTELSLINVSVTARPTTHQLLNVLRNMPSLRTLTLEDALPISASGMEESVSMPSLQQLHVTGKSNECGQLLSYLAFPETAPVIHLGCSAVNEGLASIATFLAQKCTLPPGGRKRKETLQIQGSDDASITLLSGAFPSDGYPYHDLANLRLHLELSWSRRSSSLADILPFIFARLTFSSIRVIQIRQLDEMSARAWRTLLMNVPTVCTLDVECINPEGVSDLVHVLNPQWNPGVLLPGLEDLVLRNVGFNEDDEVFDFSDLHLRSLLDVEVLHDCIMSRINYGAPLNKLVITGCFNFGVISVYGLRLLQEVVPYVEWDGTDKAQPRSTDSREESVYEVEHEDYDDFDPFDIFDVMSDMDTYE